mgnify:CR=1 FL=1
MEQQKAQAVLKQACAFWCGRNKRIRTFGNLTPDQALYQAEPYSDGEGGVLSAARSLIITVFFFFALLF